jgi:hypothetical protein
MELILLFIGALILKKRAILNDDDVGVSGAFYALLACGFFIYPLTYMIGIAFREFTFPATYGYLQPFVDYKWQLLVMGVSLSIGYLIDFKTLRNNSIGQFISKEVIRVSMLLFAVGIVGIACVELIEDMNDFYPSEQIGTNTTLFTFENKMFPIVTIILVRMAIEVLYIKRIKVHSPN